MKTSSYICHKVDEISHQNNSDQLKQNETLGGIRHNPENKEANPKTVKPDI
jgi:hypothetical protein